MKILLKDLPEEIRENLEGIIYNFNEKISNYKLKDLPKEIQDNIEIFKILSKRSNRILYRFYKKSYIKQICLICGEIFFSRNITESCSKECGNILISKRLKNREISIEHRQKISVAKTGKTSPHKNKKLEEICGEEKAKKLRQLYSETHKGLLVGEKNGRYGDNRTYEQLHGIEKATKLKNDISIRISGEGNCNYGEKHWINSASEEKIENYKQNLSKSLKGILLGIKRGTYEEQYGEIRAKEIKEKLSISGIAREIPPAENTSYGFGGWFMNFYFRSLPELSFLLYCFENDIKVESAENKDFIVKYIAEDGKERRYFPDFYLPESNIIIEIKPLFKLKEKATKLKLQAGYKKYGKNYKILLVSKIKNIEINKLKLLYESGTITLNKNTIRRIYK